MPDPAYQAALKMLGRRDYFRAELGDRLHRKGFADAEVEAALDRCQELGLIDDERLAARFVELRAVDRGWGPRRLRAELLRRGVDRSTAEAAAAMPAALRREALQTALRRAERRARPGWWRLHDGRVRMLSSLTSRGFETDDACAAVERLAAERESQHDAFENQPGDPLRLP